MNPTSVRAVTVSIAVLAGVLAAVVPGASATADAASERLAGDDRHATAAAIAAAAFPDGAAAAVLGRGDAFPDALAGAALAASVRGPVLLTPGAALAPSTSDALDALGAGTVYLLGGAGAISDAVAAELQESGREVVRVAGTNRYATAAAVARRAGVGTIGGEATAIVASGMAFPDALAAGPLAAGAGVPILLTPADHLASETAAALRELGVQRAIVLGGTAAVSDTVVAEIQALGARVERLAGTTRAETAIAVADYALEHLGWTAARVLLARADEFADGLAGGPLGGRAAAPVLLTTPDALDAATASWLGAHRAQVQTISVLGGSGAVPDAVVEAAVDAAKNGVAAGAGAGAVAVTPTERKSVPIAGTHACEIDAPSGADTHVLVLPASAVSNDGVAHFADADRDGVADTGGTAARIAEVDGRTLSPPAERIVVDGPTQLDVTSSELGTAIVLAFVDGTGGTDGGLDLDEDGAPTETAGAGCPVTFAPESAAAGAYEGVEVTDADAAAGIFVADDDSGTFTFDADDVFKGRAGSIADFANAVSRGDVLDIDYVADGTSTFELVEDAVLAPEIIVATATVLDDGTAVDDVSVDFDVPRANGMGTTYIVNRAATYSSGDGCSSSQMSSPTNEGTTTTSPFEDLDVAEGCHTYRIIATSSTGTSALSDVSAPVKTPGTPIGTNSERPASIWATVTTSAGRSGELDAGDVVTIVFDEPLATPASPAMTVRTASGGTSTIGGSLASFTLNDTATSVGGQSRPARTVLTVKVLGAPSPAVALPTDVVGSSGIVDIDGLAWDVAASSDRRLDVS